MARKYVRDNRGRFASVGATTRGGRLRTAAGNKRAAVTMQGPKRAGTVAKPRGLKPGAVAARRAAKAAAPAAPAKRTRTPKAASGPRSRNARVASKIKELEKVSPGGVSRPIREGLATFTPKNVNGVVVAARLDKLNKEGKLSKFTPQQMRRAQNAFDRGKFTASVAPQAFASQESIRLAVKRAAAQRAAKKAGKATEKQRNLREFMTQNRGAVARDYRSDAQAFRTRLPKKEQTAGGAKTVGGALEALASKSYQRNASRQGLFASEAARAQRLIGDNGIKGYKMQRTPYGSIVVRNGSVSAKAARLAEAAVTRGLARKGRNSRSRRAG